MDLTAEGAAVDILELLAPTDAIVVIHAVTVTQKTEAGDALDLHATVIFEEIGG